MVMGIKTEGTYARAARRQPQTADLKSQPYSGQGVPNMLTQCFTVDPASGFLGRDFHDLAELRL
jgi:hypothetical protein